jgi:Zn-dependent protease
MKIPIMRKFTVEMHRNAWILIIACILFGVKMDGWPFGAILGASMIVSLLLHEVGHMLAAISLGVPVYGIGLRLFGAYNRRERSHNRRDEVLISLAGPGMNLLLAAPLLFIPHIGVQLALGNLGLCLVNLLPIPSSDGMRILQTLRGPAIPTAPKAAPISAPLAAAVMVPALSETRPQ